MAYEGVTEILNSYITSDDLKIATNRYNAAVSSNNCNASMRFEYALALTRSRYSVDQLRAIQLLEDLCVSGDNEAFRDYLYYLTIANIKLQNYDRALACIKKFLSVEPENRQAKDLKDYIDSKLFRDGMKGLAIVGGVAVALGTAVAIAFSKK
ncbi:hypothetical protein RDWZM_001624 [Blomia tropicalis]|uniref:Mitochondrial fission 1 protein n=1 Tax=Blomia tropicalis TaxID=40697 RepID=A0A9Q0MCB1_BLOTA|nr:mitochondrial membrane protein [Blomia tropicalis]KAJ6223079.1 hypothetical protein RDWZM_001624 [Blomia tropicalis]